MKAKSKSEFRRLKAQGANPIPPGPMRVKTEKADMDTPAIPVCWVCESKIDADNGQFIEGFGEAFVLVCNDHLCVEHLSREDVW
jgi:hypothetical protein